MCRRQDDRRASVPTPSGPAMTRRTRLREVPRTQVTAGRRRGPDTEHVADTQRPRAEPGQHVRGQAPEDRGDVDPSRDGDGAPQVVAYLAHRQLLARCQWDHRVGRHRPTVDSHGGETHHGHMGGARETQSGPERSDLDGAGSVVVADETVGRPQGDGSAAPARGTPRRATPMRPRSWTVDNRPGAITSTVHVRSIASAGLVPGWSHRDPPPRAV